MKLTLRKILPLALCASIALCLGPVMAATKEPVRAQARDSGWDARRALNDISMLLSYGPRAPDLPGHEKAIQYIKAEMLKAKASKVEIQKWTEMGDMLVSNRPFGQHASTHDMQNVIVRFNPELKNRIIVGTHYDSIIRAYADEKAPYATMPGANNSGSGVALLLETARAMAKLPPPKVGIDFIFFDGEEGPLSLGAGDPYWHAVGSPHFAAHLTDFYPDAKPEQAILFDMVCYKDMVLKPEPASVAYAPAQVRDFWEIGEGYSKTIFSREPYPSPISDDHNAFGDLGIPSFLVIGFEYAPWFNTTQDTIDKCSGPNLKAVGNTLVDYIYSRHPG